MTVLCGVFLLIIFAVLPYRVSCYLMAKGTAFCLCVLQKIYTTKRRWQFLVMKTPQATISSSTRYAHTMGRGRNVKWLCLTHYKIQFVLPRVLSNPWLQETQVLCTVLSRRSATRTFVGHLRWDKSASCNNMLQKRNNILSMCLPKTLAISCKQIARTSISYVKKIKAKNSAAAAV
jgi:hypothetical protein